MIVDDMAQTLCAALNRMTVTGAPLNAAVEYVPDFSLENLASRRVLVIPDNYEITRETRGANAYKMRFGIVVCGRCERADFPAWLKTVVEIGEQLLRLRLGNGWVTAIEHDPLYVPSSWLEQKNFFSAMTVTVETTLA